jgi:hypothetical protein
MGSQKLLPGYIEVKECTKPAPHAMLAGDGNRTYRSEAADLFKSRLL